MLIFILRLLQSKQVIILLIALWIVTCKAVLEVPCLFFLTISNAVWEFLLSIKGFTSFFFFSIFSAVFTWTNLLVVVAELDGPETEALDLVPLITNTVLEEHHLIVGIVVIADPGTVPINSRGEKQRMHLRDGFLADQLDPIYVAYNM